MNNTTTSKRVRLTTFDTDEEVTVMLTPEGLADAFYILRKNPNTKTTFIKVEEKLEGKGFYSPIGKGRGEYRIMHETYNDLTIYTVAYPKPEEECENWWDQKFRSFHRRDLAEDFVNKLIHNQQEEKTQPCAQLQEF